jgi:radical SAM superfamily enzyme YgiQ (UPF0313 family)
MNILLIYSTDNIDTAGKFLNHPGRMYFGHSYISAFLKRHGYNVSLLVLSRMLGKKNHSLIEQYVSETNPNIIGYTAVASEYSFIAEMAKYSKNKYRDVYHLLGGVHATLNPEDVIKDDFDAVCIGEGEFPLLELADMLKEGKEITKIRNLWIKKGDSIERNQTRPYIEDLDILPFPDRGIWEEWIDDTNDAPYMILLGRGCPFQCTYCSNHALKKVTQGKYVRFRSVENIINEIKNIISIKPAKRKFYFEIDTILVNPTWVYELCDKLEEFNKTLDAPITFGTNIRIIPNFDIKPIMDSLKKAGCTLINIGLESGSERVRIEILKRKYSNEMFLNTVNYAKEIGLQVFVYNMIGLPTETIEDINKTIEINRLAQPTMTRTSIFYPYKGTDLYKFCVENNLFSTSSIKSVERTDSVLNMPQISRKQIIKNYIWFDYNVYKGFRSKPKFFVQAIIKSMVGKPYFIYLNRILSSKKIRGFIRRFLS